jgi:hypothetical protein
MLNYGYVFRAKEMILLIPNWINPSTLYTYHVGVAIFSGIERKKEKIFIGENIQDIVRVHITY